MSSPPSALRALALRHPEVEEGVACKGTALESSTFKAGAKAFLFVNAKDARLKLAESVGEAQALAEKEPERWRVGAHGWVTVSLAEALPMKVLERWIAESHALAAGPTVKTKPRRSPK